MAGRTVTVLSASRAGVPGGGARSRLLEPPTQSAEWRDGLAELLAAHGGEVLAGTATEVLAIYGNASGAVAAAVAAQRHATETPGGPGRRSGLRVGLSIGEVTGEGADPTGAVHALATELCTHAHPGQILAVRAVRLVAGAVDGVGYTDAGSLSLRSVAEPLDVDEVAWGGFADRPLRILLADDAVLIREGVARLLQDEGFVIVGVTGDASRLLELTTELGPDVVITDVRMPPSFTLEGLRAAVELRRRFPEIGVLVLSQYIETRYAVDLLGDGARGVGYLLKERVGAVEEFLAAIRRVAAGGTAVDPEMIAVLMGRSQREGGLERLSPRETQILSVMAQGQSNAGIARQLSLAVRTVESHVGAIFTKLNLLPELDDERRVLAVIEYLRGAGVDPL